MRAAVALSALVGFASAAAPSINGLGSSYASGPSLSDDQQIGAVLRDKLNSRPRSTQYTFNNLAISGTNLSSVHDQQAPELADKNPAIVYMVSGGNDLNYVKCLNDPDNDVCKHSISEDEFIKRYSATLDAIVSNTGYDTKLPIYAITYITAIGKDTICATGRDDCNLTSDQETEVKGIYTDVDDWTVGALKSWQATGNNKNYNVKMIPMRDNSVGHDVGSSAPWINGVTVPNGAGGTAWHPNIAGAEAIANFIYNDLNNAI